MWARMRARTPMPSNDLRNKVPLKFDKVWVHRLSAGIASHLLSIALTTARVVLSLLSANVLQHGRALASSQQWWVNFWPLKSPLTILPR